MGRRNHRPASGPFRESFDGALDELWATIASGDVLHAEVQTSVFASMALMADGAEAVGPEKFADAVLDSAIRDQLTPESAAFCRLVVSLGTPVLKREASRRLKEHTDDGVYPPDWVAAAGRPAPRSAWRSYDVFGDLEYIVVTFGYGEAEHAILVGIDMTTTRPAVIFLTVSDETDKLIEIVRDRPFERFGEITLAEARRRVEQPLASADADLDLETNESSFTVLPVVRSRVRRLRRTRISPPSSTRPPTAPPPWPISWAARMPAPLARLRRRDSGPRCSPGTAAVFRTSRPVRWARTSWARCCCRTSCGPSR